jgi:UDP-N-acetylmuramyl pentapeptide phosphotransferase/UDP-N-acetylglucosamine-1-phosphate transferase
MIFYYFKICLIIFLCFFVLNWLSSKFSILKSKFYSNHQQLVGSESVPLIGGIILFISLCFNRTFNDELIIYSSLALLILGILSDIDYLKSPFTRLSLQLLIILIFLYLSELRINDLRINYLNIIFSNYYFGLFFSTFCLLIILNGSNFIDGLNGLNLGYFLIVLIVLLLSSFLNKFNIDYVSIIPLIIVISFLLILNYLNYLYIGDSGAYLIGFVISIYILKIHTANPLTSPYFFALLLWYPAFENFFSILRKKIHRYESTLPDTKHLHQLIYRYLFKKNFRYSQFSNQISSILINVYNLCIFLFSINFLDKTLYLCILIIFNIFIYLSVYSALRVKY